MKVKSKWSGAAFLMLALALVAGLALVAAPAAPPAAAEDLAWSSVEGDFPLHGLPPGVGQIIDVDVLGNTVFVLADAAAGDNSVEIYRSDDGGYRWEPPNAVTAPGATVAEVGVAIAISPNYATDGAVHVLLTDAGPVAWVITSTDKGVTWPFVTANVLTVPPGVPAPTTAATLAVSPVFNALASGGQIVIGGTNDGAVAPLSICTWYETWQGPTVGWSGAWTGIAQNAAEITTPDCLAVEYSPTSSLNLAAVMEDAANTYGITGTIAGPWPAIAVANPPLCAQIHTGVAAGAVIALPDDYNPVATPACLNCPIYFFVGTWGVAFTGIPNTQSSTFWFDTIGLAFADLKATSTMPGVHYQTSGLVADGNYARATLITGCYGYPMTYNCDVRSQSWSAPVFIEGNGGPMGTVSTTVGVLLAYTGSGNTVYAATTDLVAAGGFFTAGDLCCVSRSDDFAASWSDTCLTSENFRLNVTDMVWLDGQTGIIACSTAVVPTIITGWESSFKTWDKGLSWKRVDRWQDVAAVALAPDGTIVLLDMGTTGDKVLVSTDNGETFAPTAADPPTLVTQLMTAIAAGSATDIFVGDVTGHIYVTNDGGATWTDVGALGSQIYSLEVPDGYADAPYAAAGMVSSTGMLEILVSSDAGASWAQWGSGSTQAAGWGAGGIYIGAEFSPTFDGAADSLLYIHTVGAGFDGIYRGDLGATTEVWQRLLPVAIPIDAIDLVYIPTLDGVDGMTGNALYAAVWTQNILLGSWNPETVTAVEPYLGLWRTDSINATPALIADGGAVYLTIGVMDAVYSDAGVDLNIPDTAPAPDLVRNWVDTAGFLTPVATTWPADGSIVPSNDMATGEPVQLQWMPVMGAMTYEVTVARDPLKLSRIVFVDSWGFVRSPDRTVALQSQMSIPVGTLTDGETYYWWVRVTQHGGTAAANDHQGPWNDARSFTVEAVEMHAAPALISPASGDIDIGIRPLFKWSGVQDATGYTLLVDDDPAFGSPVIDESLGVQQTYQPAVDLAYETTYSWQVVATGADWASPPADGIFTTIPSWAEPAAPTTPFWIWVLIVLGAVLAITVIVLIVRTRRAV